MAFAGFPASVLEFLRGIAANNSRPWYEAHRSTFESAWLDPARDFVVEVADALRPDVPEIGAEPKVNGSIIRLQRDTRFSHDKRPYKDHLDLWWWVGGATERRAPGFFVRLIAEHLYLGGGSHGFEDALLLRYRRAIGDGEEGERLAGLLAELRREGGWQIAEPVLKRVPAPYAVDHPQPIFCAIGRCSRWSTWPIRANLRAPAWSISV